MSASLYKPSSLFDLAGRIAIVTGGGTGIGHRIATGFAASGAKVYITGRRLEVLEKAAKEWNKKDGGEIIPLQMDVTDKISIQAAKEFISNREKKIHILVNNAGQSGPKATFFDDTKAPQHTNAETLGQALFDSESLEDWGSLYQVNVGAMYFMTVAFMGLLARGSEDIQGYSSTFCYNSSKAAARHLTRLLSTELALKGVPIRVNAIAPGIFESEMTSPEINPEDASKMAKALNPIPVGRAGRAEEMAGTAVYLASRAGGYMNGQELPIDGGFLATNP